MPAFSLCRESWILPQIRPIIRRCAAFPPRQSSRLVQTERAHTAAFWALLRGSWLLSEQPPQGGFPRNLGESTANKIGCFPALIHINQNKNAIVNKEKFITFKLLAYHSIPPIQQWRKPPIIQSSGDSGGYDRRFIPTCVGMMSFKTAVIIMKRSRFISFSFMPAARGKYGFSVQRRYFRISCSQASSVLYPPSGSGSSSFPSPSKK